jgi:predicted ATPase/class 3 adenylate cyclase
MNPQRALLLTDVIDSTGLSQALGDAETARFWTAYDRAARDLLPLWRGREIDKADGMLLLFDSAADAASYALAYHRALAALDLPCKARAGLHVGPVALRENSAADVALGAKPLEIEGLAKSIVARVMSVAIGGQTLLTGDARIALEATELRVQSHGHWRLRGLPDPVELFEVGDQNSPFTPPSDEAKVYRVVRVGDLWRPAREVRHTVPAERDSFVGRREAMVALARKLDDGARLVSVLGIGGTGKTRLVTRFAWTWLGEFPGGVWFCDLSQARTLDGIVFAVAQGLDVPLGKTDPVVQLSLSIAARGDCLVILDNFEQVARHAEDTLGHWLARAPEAKFVVTTREVLGIVGEETLALAPLPVDDAARLFVRRAESARDRYRPTADDRIAIEQLVKLLDGLPLAIELAAARVRIMPPRTLLLRMSERFRLLASPGGRQDRQATLRATFDWSWDLLSAIDKATLAQLSVFEGGFSLEAAEAVLELPEGSAAPWPADAVQSLVDKSLVRQVDDRRFELLASVQEYAAEHLRTAGRYEGSGPAAALQAQARHGAFFATRGERWAIAEAHVDLDNLVMACRRAVQRGEGVIAVQALEAAWAALRLRGPFSAALELASSLQSMRGLTAAETCRLSTVTGGALEAVGRMSEARKHLKTALVLAQKVGDTRCQARVLTQLAALDRNAGRIVAAKRRLATALRVSRLLGDPTLQCEVESGLGSLYSEMGRLDEALAHNTAALRLARAAGDRRWEAGLRGNIGNIHAIHGRMSDALDEFGAALAVARELGDRQWEGNMLCNLGWARQTQGCLEDAQSHFEAAIAIARDIGHARLECIVLCNLGLVFDARDRLDMAERAYHDGLRVARRMEDHRSEGQILGYLGLAHARQDRFEAARDCFESGEQLLIRVADRLSLGILLCKRAEAESMAGLRHAAEVSLERAHGLAVEIGIGAESELGASLAQARGRLDNDKRRT